MLILDPGVQHTITIEIFGTRGDTRITSLGKSEHESDLSRPTRSYNILTDGIMLPTVCVWMCVSIDDWGAWAYTVDVETKNVDSHCDLGGH